MEIGLKQQNRISTGVVCIEMQVVQLLHLCVHCHCFFPSKPLNMRRMLLTRTSIHTYFSVTSLTLSI